MSRLRLGSIMVGAAAAIASVVVVGPVASASGAAIRPHQYFIAEVNGRTGETLPAEIAMACFGPVQPGETGHPMAGQTVGVREVGPAAPATVALGYTGNRARSIGVFFGAPPPASASAPTFIDLTHYGPTAIPTSLVLPCGGTGHATFEPLPLDPSAHGVAVPVTFVGQP